MVLYPIYVPSAVRDHVTKVLQAIDKLCSLYGQSLDPLEWPFESLIRYTVPFNESWTAEDVHLNFVCYEQPNKDPRDDLLRHKNILLKLVQEPDMKEAYAILTGEFDSDEEWRRFIWAASVSNHSYDYDL